MICSFHASGQACECDGGEGSLGICSANLGCAGRGKNAPLTTASLRGANDQANSLQRDLYVHEFKVDLDGLQLERPSIFKRSVRRNRQVTDRVDAENMILLAIEFG